MPTIPKKNAKASVSSPGRFFKPAKARVQGRQISGGVVAVPVAVATGDAVVSEDVAWPGVALSVASVAVSQELSGQVSGHDSDNRTDMADTLEIPVRTRDATKATSMRQVMSGDATGEATATTMTRHDSDSDDKLGDSGATVTQDVSGQVTGHTPVRDATDATPDATGHGDIGHDIGDVSGHGSDKGQTRDATEVTAKDAVRTETLSHIVDDRTVVSSTSWMLVVAGKEYVLPGARVVVGRRPSTDDDSLTLRIDDPTRTISRVHALLTKEGDDWFVEDLHSGNGVSVITVRGGERKIVPGDRVLASEEMMFGDQLVELKRLAF